MGCVVRIAVFDSGLGSLSIIRAIQRTFKSEIIYLADQANYPYGKKSRAQLLKITNSSIRVLHEGFSPDIIVVASNTPSLMLDMAAGRKRRPLIIDVKPPLGDVTQKSRTKRIGILATKSAVNSRGLSRYIQKNNLSRDFQIFKIDGSNLVELVESGKFISNKGYCQRIIKKTLEEKLVQNNIDLITLSSTHLPFLKPLLTKQFPKITFIDPADMVAKKISSRIKNNQIKRNSLKIFTTGDKKVFQTKLARIGIKNRVSLLPF